MKLVVDGIAKSVEEAKKEPKNKGKKIKPADAPYKTDEEAGTITFNFKQKAKGKTKQGEEFTQQPALFDAQGHPLKAGVKIGGGSEIKVSFEVVPFYTALVGAGVSLRMKAVQILKLQEYQSGNASSYGFEAEAGFDSSEAPAGEDASSKGTESDDEAPAPDAAGGDAGDF